MSHYIAEPCIDVKDKACVEVCPVDCIHSAEGERQFYINPEECIDCSACVEVCPVQAIFPEEDLPEKWKDFVRLNTEFFKRQRSA